MDWALIVGMFGKLADGLLITVSIVAQSLALGLALAVPVALARVSRHALPRWLAYGYIYVFRGTPLLVQLYLIYYGLAQLDIVRHTFLWVVFKEPWWCAVMALTLNTGAYTAEILRGAIQAVPAGAVEAARAVGMSRSLAFRRIVLPLAVRLGLPAYGNEVIALLKASALVSTVTIIDITGAAREVMYRTYKVYEPFLAAGIIYMVLVAVISLALRRFEVRLSRHMRRPAAVAAPVPTVRAVAP